MTRKSHKTSQSAWRIYFWPLVINCVCLLGLVSALIGNGWLDLLSWACLGGSVALLIYASFGTVDKGKVR